jgi:hypothetical protein
MDAQKHEQPVPDLADDLARHTNRSSRDALDYRSH